MNLYIYYQILSKSLNRPNKPKAISQNRTTVPINPINQMFWQLWRPAPEHPWLPQLKYKVFWIYWDSCAILRDSIGFTGTVQWIWYIYYQILSKSLNCLNKPNAISQNCATVPINSKNPMIWQLWRPAPHHPWLPQACRHSCKNIWSFEFIRTVVQFWDIALGYWDSSMNWAHLL